MLDQSTPHNLPKDLTALAGDFGNVASFPPVEPSVPEPEHGKRRRYRTIWISDVHLGTKGCNAELLIDFLDSTDSETMYLVGDIIDGWRLKKKFYWPADTTTSSGASSSVPSVVRGSSTSLATTTRSCATSAG